MAVRLLTGIILARTLGPSGFGIYSFSIAFITAIQVMPATGLNNVVVRYSAQYYAAGSWALLKGLWQVALTSAIAYGLLSAGAVIGVYFLGWFPTTAALSPPVLAVAAVPLFFMPVMNYLGASLRGTNAGVVGQLPQFVVQPLFYFLVLLVVMLCARRLMSPEVAMLAQGMAALGTTLLGANWLVKSKPKQMRGVRPSYAPRRWLHSAPLFCLMGGLMLINIQADVLMLGILGNARETGLYRVAATGANLVALSLTAANLYIGPRISALYSRGKTAELQRLLVLSVRSTFMVASVAALTFWLLGTHLLKFAFGAEYAEAFLPLAILCFGQLINVGSGSVGLVLGMTGHEGNAAALAGMAAACNIVLNAVMIPRFGTIGSAIATTSTVLIWNGMMLTSVKKLTGLNTSIFARCAP